MRMTNNRVVAIDYTIRLPSGETVESSVGDRPLRYLHGRSQIVPGVERALAGLELGPELVIEVPPAEGYGERDPAGVFLVPRAVFPPTKEVLPGMAFSAVRPDGQPILFRVLRTEGDAVLVDTNHPLAGKTLLVWVAVREVREATDEERDDGQVGGEVTTAPQYLS